MCWWRRGFSRRHSSLLARWTGPLAAKARFSGRPNRPSRGLCLVALTSSCVGKRKRKKRRARTTPNARKRTINFRAFSCLLSGVTTQNLLISCAAQEHARDLSSSSSSSSSSPPCSHKHVLRAHPPDQLRSALCPTRRPSSHLVAPLAFSSLYLKRAADAITPCSHEHVLRAHPPAQLRSARRVARLLTWLHL